mmetsp:Transcript_82161/g.163698  ORF Transcript_82161/g.163698 Transcript_82161/m.163698 type:complete len:292 (+) Transcript_82161:497-1372(+)
MRHSSRSRRGRPPHAGRCLFSRTLDRISSHWTRVIVSRTILARAMRHSPRCARSDVLSLQAPRCRTISRSITRCSHGYVRTFLAPPRNSATASYTLLRMRWPRTQTLQTSGGRGRGWLSFTTCSSRLCTGAPQRSSRTPCRQSTRLPSLAACRQCSASCTRPSSRRGGPRQRVAPLWQRYSEGTRQCSRSSTTPHASTAASTRRRPKPTAPRKRFERTPPTTAWMTSWLTQVRRSPHQSPMTRLTADASDQKERARPSPRGRGPVPLRRRVLRMLRVLRVRRRVLRLLRVR